MELIKKMNNTLIDNSDNLKLVDTIKEILADISINQIDIATGYWDIPGMMLLTDVFDSFLQRNNAKLRLLIGKDPLLMIKHNNNPKYKDFKYPEDFIRSDINEIEVKPEYEKAVSFLLKYLDNQDKMEIRIFKENENKDVQFLHSKCWIFISPKSSYGIIGSSNFTQKGLEGNAELNYLETNGSIIMTEPKNGAPAKGHEFWFNEKWDLSEDWSKEFLEQILKPSPIAQKVINTQKTSVHEKVDDFTKLTPYETYMKFLIDQFGEIIETDGKIKENDYLPKDPNFKKLTYQLEAVNQASVIMKRHNGCIIADVVGLGKTFTALMIVKKFLLENGFSKPVLIITPPAIKKNWIDSIEYFDKNEAFEKQMKDKITLTTIGCLDNESEANETMNIEDFDDSYKQDDFGLIVVDESHRFRNNDTIMYQRLDNLIGECNAKVLLLSATPQNNAPYDLRNQIFLFQREHKKSTLPNLENYGSNLEGYFSEKERNYKDYIRKDKIVDGNKVSKTKEELETDKRNLEADSESIRKCIIEPLVIRRTRTDVQKYYEDDVKQQGLSFPKIQPPKAIEYEMKNELAQLFNDTIDIVAPLASKKCYENEQMLLDIGNKKPGVDALGYYRYRAIEYLKPEHQKLYEKHNLTASKTAEHLAGLMEILLIKRLESSKDAFEESLNNLKRYTQNMIKMWEADRIFICPNLDINKELNDENVTRNGGLKETLDVIAEKAKKANEKHHTQHNIEYSQAEFNKEYIDLLENDLKLIDNLCSKWALIRDDVKLEKFIAKIETFMDKEKNPTQKLIIFTECIATQKVLVKKLRNVSEYKILEITAKNRDDMKEIIAANFDANYKGEQRDDYDILITTDVLAEGVNLHRANTILNYDSPWNATRLMQRLGRINRIGTTAKKIWHYNFYPSTLGDEQINLKNRTFVKLQAFHELFGEDSQIYSTDEEVKQHEKIKYETDEESETPIMPFIAELREFKKDFLQNYERLEGLEKVTTCICDENKNCFAQVNIKNQNNEYLQKCLYITNESKTAKKVSQLEFFEKLKPLSQYEQIDCNEVNYQEYKSCFISAYEADYANKKISTRDNKSKNGKKEQDEAIKKMKRFYEKEISEETENKLDFIIQGMRNQNQTLIRKVLEYKFDFNQLDFVYEAEITHLYKIARPQKEVIENAELAIVFCCK